jgi:hypothetical protein
MKALFFYVLVLLSSPASATSYALALFGASEERPGTPVVYDPADCAADSAIECSQASLDCSDGLGLSISIDGLDDAAVAHWLLRKEGLVLKLKGVRAEGEPGPSKILLSDMDGTWSVVFLAPYSQDPGLVLDEPLKTLAIESFARSLSVLLSGKTRTPFEDFIQSCQSE